MKHFIKNKNLGLIVGRQGQVVGEMLWNLLFITKDITDLNLYYRGGGCLFPLYLYPETKEEELFTSNEEKIQANLAPALTNTIGKKIGLEYCSLPQELFASGESENKLFPVDILDYIYAVLHSPTYREKYKEFLKIDFPRVPYPKSKETFWQLVKLGKQIREIHLLESETVEEQIAHYPIAGDNEIITKIAKKDWELYDEEKQLVKIWINEEQYFDNIPLHAWEFYIGGYQPAQKWLKDRIVKKDVLNPEGLSTEEVRHYIKIISALSHTHRLMQEIDSIEIE